MSDNKYNQNQPVNSELGKKSSYDDGYNPARLYAILRAGKRAEIGIQTEALPFWGFDCWNHYEVSWLNLKGKPVVATAELYYDCSTPCIIESKSLKLYFNSFNNARFDSCAEVEKTIKQDLEKAIQGEVTVNIHLLSDEQRPTILNKLDGQCLDNLDIVCEQYVVEPAYLKVLNQTQQVEEILYSDLLKSNCLVTNQPDWGSVQIKYKGHAIDREGLLKYLVSFRNHNEFHEQCIERIFMDIMNYCKPDELTVYGRYTRRGGIDINPLRSSKPVGVNGMNQRLIRQ